MPTISFEEVVSNLTKLEKLLDTKAGKVLEENSNQFFLIIMGIIIYFMQCGFAFLEAGSVRSKNTTNILIKNLLDTFIAGLAFWVVGFPFGHGKGNYFIGTTYWASDGLPDTSYALWFFNFVFAATAATIVSGAVAERCEFVAYLVYSIVLTGFMYPVVVHWAWNTEGWLSKGIIYNISGQQEPVNIKYEDFAGSGVVHVLGGTAAFVGALFLGPRIGRFDENGHPHTIRGHSVPLAAMGGFILIFGFFAFNGGSQASISEAGDGAAVSLAITNTVISGSAAAFVTLLFNRMRVPIGGGRWSLLSTLNGALAGMVAICAGCNQFHPWSAFVTGLFAAISYMLWSWLNLSVFKVDDPLDAVAVHFGGGLWGVLAVPLLKKDTGLLFAWDQAAGYSIAWNLAGVLAIVAWTASICTIVFGILKYFGLLRVSEEVELKGLDIKKHNEPAYPTEAYGHGWDNQADIVKSLIKEITLSHLEESDKANTLTRQVIRSGYQKSSENPEVLHQSQESIADLVNGHSPNGKLPITGNNNSAYLNSSEQEDDTRL